MQRAYEFGRPTAKQPKFGHEMAKQPRKRSQNRFAVFDFSLVGEHHHHGQHKGKNKPKNSKEHSGTRHSRFVNIVVEDRINKN